MKKLLKWGLVGFVILIILGVVAGSGKKSTNNQPTTTTQTNQTTEQQADAAKQDTTQNNAPKQWVTVTELNGTANKSSDTFALTGGKVRLTYDFQGKTAVVGGVYLLKEGVDLQTDGGIPEVMISKVGSDSTILRKAAGNYYLQVNAANSTWSVKVEEEK